MFFLSTWYLMALSQYIISETRVVLDSDFQADSTLTHLTIQVTQL